MSCWLCKGRMSVREVCIADLLTRECRLKIGDALLDIERGLHPLQRQSELHQGDRDRRLHADHHGACIEDAGHGGEIGDDATDERIHQLQRRDVQQDAFRTGLFDFPEQIVLQRQCQLIIHFNLDGDEQKLAHLQNRNSVHRRYCSTLLRCIVTPVRLSASASASAKVALVVTPSRSTPRWTMVCAICERIPQKKHTTPNKQNADTNKSRSRATNKTTDGTPVISMMATSAPVSTMRCCKASVTIWVRALSNVPLA